MDDLRNYYNLRSGFREQAVAVVKNGGYDYRIGDMPQSVVGLNNSGQYENLIKGLGGMGTFAYYTPSPLVIPDDAAICIYAVSNHGDKQINGLDVTLNEVKFSFYMKPNLSYLGASLFELQYAGILPLCKERELVSVCIYADEPVVKNFFLLGIIGYRR